MRLRLEVWVVGFRVWGLRFKGLGFEGLGSLGNIPDPWEELESI